MSRLGNSAMQYGNITPREGADKRRRGPKPERFGCLKIDNEIELGRLYNWEGVT